MVCWIWYYSIGIIPVVVGRGKIVGRSMWVGWRVGGGGVWGKDKSKFYFHVDVLHTHTIHVLCTNILSCQKFRNIYLHFNQNNLTKKTNFIKNTKSIIAISNYKNSLTEENKCCKRKCFVGFFFNVGKKFIALCGSGYLLKNVHLGYKEVSL